MGEAYFYHLTHTPLEVTLPMLLGKARGAGWAIAVRGTSPDRMDWLDQKLWLGPEDAFLPHGLAGGDHDALQPVLLTTGAAANDPACLMTVDGAEVTAEEVKALQRTCILFDGTDPQAVQHARGQWKSLTDAGCGAKYWSEETGSWQMKAEKAAV
ncbi:DNA polymerase III subunit chi [Pseudooceanicola onchidii]|uniref:DNA polymerase III subunit chi n=1 Tax=Pseudooceanicola onchidii TaxID=2562279 RepID=UPI0010AA8504|nr:DNA polymerase III subunit chi [Pseudooceanicola onchidii]